MRAFFREIEHKLTEHILVQAGEDKPGSEKMDAVVDEVIAWLDGLDDDVDKPEWAEDASNLALAGVRWLVRKHGQVVYDELVKYGRVTVSKVVDAIEDKVEDVKERRAAKKSTRKTTKKSIDKSTPPE